MGEIFRKQIKENVAMVGVDKMTPEILKGYIKEEEKVFVIGISRETVEEYDISSLKDWNNAILKNKEARDCIYLLNINGYDDDPRELYEIPEVVAFIRKAILKNPELFYFLDEESKDWITLCFAGGKVITVGNDPSEKKVSFDVKSLIDSLIFIYSSSEAKIPKELVRAQFESYVKKFY